MYTPVWGGGDDPYNKHYLRSSVMFNYCFIYWDLHNVYNKDINNIKYHNIQKILIKKKKLMYY